ncbi:M20/M25/M40 family metallo-hydrolase [Geosporobacter ferrireducens]|uniref:Zinc carboxypeptidase n=1 Tax=Geosporobacter ferrireducens TaxID=1424294 RepID=A0A1D8GGL6_9FIRM|nr:M20/M25/M40 family metallo-hydrolase [Geosporobacter ferrireducens]AOT70048.1 hypothetical protein Gferi_10895 [Geosporobacter ferrireducens]
MYKKRWTQFIVIVLTLSLLIPTAFAMEPAVLFPDSDRGYDVQELGFEPMVYQNPFGAVQVHEEMEKGFEENGAGGLSSFSINSLLSENIVTVTGSVYEHVYGLSKKIGARVASTEKEAEARDYIVNVLKNELGYSTTVQPFTYVRSGATRASDNIIAVKPGKSSKQVIVGAHYDSVSRGTGADDNASGVAVMLGAAEMLKGIDTTYTIKFVAFGAEEVGLRGSSYYVSQMTEDEIANTVAMINLDSVVAGDKMYAYGDLGPKGWVRDQVLALAASLGLNVETNPGHNPEYPVGTTGPFSDHVPFQAAGIPWTYFEATNWEIGELDGYTQTEKHGTIFHNEKDDLDFLMEEFPGRVEERLYTFTTLLYHFLKEITPPADEDSFIGIKTSTNLLSMSEAREVEVSANLGYAPTLDNLEWAFGGLPLSAWKSFQSSSGGYTGPSFISFIKEPYIDESVVRAIIKFDLPYGTTNLQGRPNPRTRYPELLGEYNLAIGDVATKAVAKTVMKLNAYDSYHTYDEIVPAINRIFGLAKDNRYLVYKSLGKSFEGRDIPFVILAKEETDIGRYQNETLPLMLENPAALIKMIDQGAADKHKPAIWFNNMHSDEAPGIDAQIDLLEMLATQDEIAFNTVKKGTEVEVKLSVEEILDNFIILFNFAHNPDGRYHNTRTTVHGFDPNRDMSYQMQIETVAVAEEIAKWSPMIFNDLHGFVSDFLIEPCTPPHDPNYEYDLLMNGMIDHAHAMGKAGVSNTKYTGYIIPKYDYGSGWDDSAPIYGAMYAMIHGAMGHTIEMPELNQDSNDAVVYAGLGSIDYVLENKDKLFKNQLEIYRRGVEGIDAANPVDSHYINAKGEKIGRPRGEHANFFPDYYVIPVEKELQKNPLAAYEMAQYFLRNGVKVERTTTDVTVGNQTYPVGSFVIPMHQAKRGYANTLLYDGSDFSDWPAMYAEVTSSFPDLRGFDKYEIRAEGAFQGKMQKVSTVTIPKTDIPWNVEKLVIRNTNNDAIKAVNVLLAGNKPVQMVYSNGDDFVKGDFVVNKEDLEALKDHYYLELAPYVGNAALKLLKQPKVAAFGSELTFVLKFLGFHPVNYNEANVIVDESGNANNSIIKGLIQSGTSYVGVGGNAINSMAASGLLPGLSRGRTGSSHEGVLRASVDTDSVITGNYNENEVLYNKSGSWIESIPEKARVLARISNEDDYFKAGWWPNNHLVKGKAYIIQDQVEDAKITLFANHIANRAHPHHQFRMLANAIYDAIPGTVTPVTDPPSGGGSGGGGGGSSSTPKAAVNGAAGATVTLNGVRLVFPANGLDHDFVVTVSVIGNPSGLSVPANMKLLSKIYEINKNLSENFKKAVKIILPFDKGQYDAQKHELALFWFNEDKKEWIKLDNIEIDFEAGKVAGETDHFTKFAVLAVEKAAEAADEPAQATEITDIKGHWAEANILKLIGAGAITGYPDQTFRPNDHITRAEFATVLVKAFKLEQKSGTIFTDTFNHWAKDYIATAAAYGIVSGYDADKFRPNDMITREQMAAMIVKAAKLESAATVKAFTDSKDISAWAVNAVDTITAQEIINGYPDDSFRPSGKATRAEAVTVIMNALK